MLIESLTTHHNAILKSVFENYTSDVESHEVNKIFNACFELADFIVAGQSEEHLSFHEVKNHSAVFFLKAVSNLMDTFNDDCGVDWIRLPASTGGRLRESLELIDAYFSSKQGAIEILKSTKFIDNVNMIRK
jgi:hypothetical protein